MDCEKKTFDKLDFIENIKLKEQCIALDPINYEDALDLTEHGKFNHIVLTACGFGLLAVGIQNGVTGYLLPAAKCDLQMSSHQMGLMNVAFMIGGIMSACLWGILADMYGKRLILLITFGVDSIITILSALSQNHVVLMVMRLLNGFFIGGPGCLIFTYLGDMTRTNWRTKYLCYIGFAFILSWIFLPVLAFLILPLKIDILLGEYVKFNSWRLYLLISSLPSIVSTVLIFKLPESPRSLLDTGRKTEALEVLKKMFNINTGKPDKEYLIKYLHFFSKKYPKLINNPSATNVGGRMSRLIRDKMKQAITIFMKPHSLKIYILMFIFFANMFGCYGFGLWIPELLSRFRKYDISILNSTSICQLTYDSVNLAKDNNSLNKVFHGKTQDDNLVNYICDGEMNYQAFKDTVTIGMACLVYNVLSTLMSDCVNSKVLPCMSLAIAGNAAAMFLWASSPSYCLMAASLFQSAMTTGNIVVIGLVMDAFPPNISSMGVCISTMAGRVGSICSNLFFGAFMDYSCQVPVFLVAALSIGAALLVFFVKTNTNISTDKTVNISTDDMENHNENEKGMQSNIASTYI